MTGSGNIATLSLSLAIDHTWQGDLRVTLTSPSGTAHVVHDQTGGSADDVVITDLAIPTFNGEPAAGNWTVMVQDLAGLDVGTLDSWSITVTGDCPCGGAGPRGRPRSGAGRQRSACSTVQCRRTSTHGGHVDGTACTRALGLAARCNGSWRSFPGRTFRARPDR